MINKFYNLIIYAHFLERIVREHIDVPSNGLTYDTNLLERIKLPNHAIEYLEEKANKFNLTYTDFSLDLLDKRYLCPKDNLEIELLKVIDKISDQDYIDHGEYDKDGGFWLRHPRVHGVDHWMGTQIVDYIRDIENLQEIKRDLQIKTIIQ